MSTFSKQLIEEYKTEMSQTYGVFVNDTDAQTQLLNLVRGMFPTPKYSQSSDERVAIQSGLSPDCDRSNPAEIE